MLQFFKRAAASVTAAAAGKVRLFIDTDGLPKTKDELGDLVVLGNGIVSITLLGTTGLNKNYRILLQDGTFFDYSVADGRSIVSLVKVGTVGLVDTYRITFNDATTFDYTVTNARSIVDIIPPAMPGQPGATDTYTIDFNDGPNDSFIVYNGLDGQGTPTMTPAQTVGDTNTAGTAGPEYANPDHVHAHGSQTNPAHHAVATTSANGFMSSTDKTKLDGIAAGAEVNQNAFSVITGNTGTASADTKTDTIAITGGTGISTAATDTPDGLVITNTGVTQFNGRTGNVTPQQADYDAFFTTPAEASAAAPVQSVAAGTGISVNATTGNVVVTNADRGTTAVTAHEGLADPHPQYTTTAEAAAAAPVQSVNGQTGNVTVAAGTNNAAVTRTAPTASASTALTTIQSYPVAAGEITAGSEYEFFASLRVINTTAASNAVVTLSVGATNVLVLTQAIGTTAAAAPGAALDIFGRITFYSATQAECVIRASKQAAVAFDALANTAATVTVSAAGATTIDLKFNTSAATSTFIARQASIQRVK